MTHTTLSFSDEDDHCSYDPHRILATLTEAERAIVDTVFPGGAPGWVTSTDLFCAVEELEELGHPDVALSIAQHIHSESIYGCLCRNEKFEKFKDDVDDVLSTIEARFPHVTWWTAPRVYAHGHPDIDTLLADVDWDDKTSETVTFTVDPAGNGSVVSGPTTLELRAFTTPELGTLLQNLDAGDLVSGEADPVGAWLQLPANIQETMAALHFHDAYLPATGPFSVAGRVRGMDLWLGELEQLARTIQSQPGFVPRTVLSLLPSSDVPLDELVSAVHAAGILT